MKKSLMFLSIILSMEVSAQSAESFHREMITKQSFLSYMGQGNAPVFFSKLMIDQNPAAYQDPAGQSIVRNPQYVVSGYDTSVKYYVGNLYQANSDRFQFILNIPGFEKGQYFSIGYDNGVQSQKLSMNQSIFLGFSQSFQIAKQTLFNIGAGTWLGGNISESPCVDSYDRQYWCQNLTSWNDYHPNYPRHLSYIDFRILATF